MISTIFLYEYVEYYRKVKENIDENTVLKYVSETVTI